MKTSADPLDIFQAIRPLYVVLKVLGLAPYTLSSNTGRTTARRRRPSVTRLPPRHILYSLAVGVVVVVACVLSLYFRIEFKHMVARRTWLVAVDLLSRIIEHATCVSAIWTQVANRHTIVSMFTNIDSLDKMFPADKKGFHKNTKKHLVISMVAMVSSIFFGIGCDFVSRVLINGITVAVKLMTLNFIKFNKNFAYLQYYCWLCIFRQRFAFITNKLASLNDTAEPGIPSFTDLHTLRSAHFHLAKLTKTLDRIYGVQLLLTVLYIFLKVLSQTYMVVTYVQTRSGTPYLKLVASSKGVWALSNALVIVRLATTCAGTKDELKKSQTLLHKMLVRREALDNTTGDEVERFSRQLANTTLSFTAFEFFDIDKALLLAAGANVTTYLAILMQL